MAWMIDGDVLTERLRGWLESSHGENVYNSGYDDAIWHVLDVIEHMPTLTQPNEWVSVEDRLPGDSEGAVLLTNEKTVITGYRNQLFGLDGQHGIFAPASKKGGGYMQVTHWMPLPAPPDNHPPEGDKKR